MTINIKDEYGNSKSIELRYSFRSFIIYETITGKSFSPETLLDVVTYFYSTIVASDKNVVIKFDTFLNWLDQNPTAMTEFSNWLTERTQMNAAVTATDAQIEEAKQNLQNIQDAAGGIPSGVEETNF